MRVQLNKKYSQARASVLSMGKGLTSTHRIILVAIAYLIAGWLCTIFTKLGSSASPMWFPSGMGLTALLIWGQIVWFGIFLGDFFLNLILGETWKFGLISAVGSSLTAVIGWKFLRYCRFSPSLTSLKDVFSLVFLAALSAAMLNATLEAVLQASHHVLSGSNFRHYWSMVWLGDSTGVMVITPFLLRLGGDWRAFWRQSKHRLLEASLCLGLLLAVGWVVLAAKRGAIDALIAHFSTTQYLEYLPFPFVIWAAIRFQMWGAVTANLLVSLVAIAGASRGVGSFVLQTTNRGQAILLLQVFLAIVTTTSLFLSAAISERQEIERQLRDTLEREKLLAIYQARLYQQVQKLNSNLEGQVTERTRQLQEKIEETQQLYDMKTVFVQAVSHDLRTSIIGLVMLLKNLQNQIGDELSLSRSNLERLIKGSDRQLTLIKALAEDHFEEHPSLSLHCQRISLAEIVERLITDGSSLFEENQITLNNLITQELPKLYVDPLQIYQVYEHLLSNALKHNPPGIEITLDAKVETEMIRCTVSDNGVGMDGEQCKQLFKLYVRNLHNHRLTGIGLGTYQCRQIIEAHRGQIGVISTPQVGSEFWFTLPLT